MGTGIPPAFEPLGPGRRDRERVTGRHTHDPLQGGIERDAVVPGGIAKEHLRRRPVEGEREVAQRQKRLDFRGEGDGAPPHGQIQ
ncbi:MAG: hypothetical protein ACK559_27930, partial [bacterium]